jgi:trans-2,3-dihydro-3-hydroxyanthranilate isomerase
MSFEFHTIDVFTDRRFGGNPLAVVLGADALDSQTMQAIARETNLSETVFVRAAHNPGHTAAIRIFTPTQELQFAGHPTIGTAVLLADLKGMAGQNGCGDAIITLELPIGTVRIGVRHREGEAPFAEFETPKLPRDAGAMPAVEKLAAALGLIPVVDLEAIGKAFINAPHWASAFDNQGIVGAYLYTRQCLHVGASFHTRMFGPGAGVPEDPATGSAAICLAGAITTFDALPDGQHGRVLEQGFEMNRPSNNVVTMSVRGGQLEAVRLGGHAVRVISGQLRA